jgi:hypothetical protein
MEAVRPFQAVYPASVDPALQPWTAETVCLYALAIAIFPVTLVYLGLRTLGAMAIHPAAWLLPSQHLLLHASPLRFFLEKIEPLVTPDGIQLDGMIYKGKPAHEGGKAIVFFGGSMACYEGAGMEFLEKCKTVLPEDYTILLVNPRGVGKSNGFSYPETLPLDAYTACQHLIHAQGFNPPDILIWGHSLGSAGGIIGARLTQEVHGQAPAVVSDRSFGDLLTEIYHLLGWIVWALAVLLNLQIDATTAWNELNGKKHIICHSLDGIIPLEASLYEATGRPAQATFIEMNGEPSDFYHNATNIPSDAQFQQIVRSMLST